MPLTDPQSRRPSSADRRAGVWECPTCEAVNGPEDDLCWNCESTRGGEPKAEEEDELAD